MASAHKRIWVGFSPKLGTVIYDTDLNRKVEEMDALDEDTVMLWVASTGRLRPIAKEVAREGLQPLWRHLVMPPQCLSADVARQQARDIGAAYFARQKQATAEAKTEDYSDDYLVDEEAEKERAQLIEDFSSDQDDWARSDDEGWFYPD